MPTTNPYLAIALHLIATGSIVVLISLVIIVALLVLRACHKKKAHLTATTTPPDEEKQQLIITTPGETPAGPPPMAWQADYGLIPQMGAPPPPYMMGVGMGMGMGGMMMGGMGSMWPGAMNNGGMGEPTPQYLPPGPMPYGGGMMGGFGGGMAPWGYGGMPPMGIPGVETRGPKGCTTINLMRPTGSSSRQKAFLGDLLAGRIPEPSFEMWQFPASDNVGEFLTHIGGNKDRYRVTEVRELGNGEWDRGLTVKWADELGRDRRLEAVGWGVKAGMHNGKPVFVVLWKKPEH